MNARNTVGRDSQAPAHAGRSGRDDPGRRRRSLTAAPAPRHAAAPHVRLPGDHRGDCDGDLGGRDQRRQHDRRRPRAGRQAARLDLLDGREGRGRADDSRRRRRSHRPDDHLFDRRRAGRQPGRRVGSPATRRHLHAGPHGSEPESDLDPLDPARHARQLHLEGRHLHQPEVQLRLLDRWHRPGQEGRPSLPAGDHDQPRDRFQLRLVPRTGRRDRLRLRRRRPSLPERQRPDLPVHQHRARLPAPVRQPGALLRPLPPHRL